MGNANQRQVAGSHYATGGMQHWDLVALFELDYYQGQITKYVMRWRKKNGIVDLEKAAHFLEKYIELEKHRAAGTLEVYMIRLLADSAEEEPCQE